MIQIIPSNKRPSTSEKFGDAFANLGQAAGQLIPQYMMQRQQQESLKNLFGEDVSRLSPELQKEFITKKLQGDIERQKMAAKYAEQLKMIRSLGLGDGFDEGSAGMGFSSMGEGAESGEEGFGSSPASSSRSPQLIPQSKINAMAFVNPSVADKMQQYNNNLLAQQRHAEKQQFAEKRFAREKAEKTPEFQREQQLTKTQALSDAKYNQELQAASKQHAIKMQTLDRLEKINKKGVTGKPWEHYAEKAGLVALTSEGRREFAADVKNLITDIRSILGSQFSQFEFQTILNAYPSADFSQKANEAIIKNLKEFEKIRDKEFEIANRLKKQNGGKIPSDFQARVNEDLERYAQSRAPAIKENLQQVLKEEYGVKNVLMFDPSGEPLDVPQDQVEHYQSLGATLP